MLGFEDVRSQLAAPDTVCHVLLCLPAMMTHHSGTLSPSKLRYNLPRSPCAITAGSTAPYSGEGRTAGLAMVARTSYYSAPRVTVCATHGRSMHASVTMAVPQRPAVTGSMLSLTGSRTHFGGERHHSVGRHP